VVPRRVAVQNGAVPAGEAKQQPSKDEASVNAEAAVVVGLVRHMILRETTRRGHTAVKHQAVKHAAFKHEEAVKHDANCRLESGSVDAAFYTFGCRPERLAAAGYAGCRGKGGSNDREEVVDAERIGGMDEWDARQARVAQTLHQTQRHSRFILKFTFCLVRYCLRAD
jgi:hypothetical protein